MRFSDEKSNVTETRKEVEFTEKVTILFRPKVISVKTVLSELCLDQVDRPLVKKERVQWIKMMKTWGYELEKMIDDPLESSIFVIDASIKNRTGFLKVVSKAIQRSDFIHILGLGGSHLTRRAQTQNKQNRLVGSGRDGETDAERLLFFIEASPSAFIFDFDLAGSTHLYRRHFLLQLFAGRAISETSLRKLLLTPAFESLN